uniref:Zona pellucida sperm-binding protein 3 n=1 Tax=Chelydra serpentina TaxID=8475 RepID=A0A8C3SJ31_CHESE
MGPSCRQAHVPSLAQPYPWARVDASQLRAVSLLQPVTVQCEEAQMVITVHRDLSGMGQLLKAADLSLGLAACQDTSFNAAENTVTFAAGLHECGSTFPLLASDKILANVVLKASLNAISGCKNDTFISNHPLLSSWPWGSPRVPWLQILLNDWSAERPSNGFQLGEVMHIEADVSTGNHVALSLFVDSCVATLSPYRDSSPRYAVIVFNGCLLDGRSDDTISAFISPRPRQDTLKFMVDAFRFAGNTSNFIYITCHLKVTSAEQAPDPLNKACSFTKVSNVWSTVEGTRNICSCCEAGNCGQPGQSRRVNTLDSWPGRCFQREMSSGNGELSNALCLLNGVAMSSS